MVAKHFFNSLWLSILFGCWKKSKFFNNQFFEFSKTFLRFEGFLIWIWRLKCSSCSFEAILQLLHTRYPILKKKNNRPTLVWKGSSGRGRGWLKVINEANVKQCISDQTNVLLKPKYNCKSGFIVKKFFLLIIKQQLKQTFHFLLIYRMVSEKKKE